METIDQILHGTLIGLVGGVVIFGLKGKLTEKKLESGFANPKVLRCECIDEDRNRLYETLLIYKGRRYHAKEDEKGNLLIYPIKGEQNE